MHSKMKTNIELLTNKGEYKVWSLMIFGNIIQTLDMENLWTVKPVLRGHSKEDHKEF